MLRLRSDEQLVALFRDGHEEAFRVIHDRYKQRLFAYTRQMLPGSRQDAEDALQDVFVRAYAGLRASDRQLSLRAWLYRVAHNRCVDELRRPLPPAPEVLGILRSPVHDPTVEAERRESLRRLIEDVRRLPDQQRSALLMRELAGMPYSDVSGALGVSVPAVKSLLVRARMGLAQALEARDTACSEIREELAVAHDRGVRPSGLARRHMHDCEGCREFRGQMRGASRQLAALVPIGPLGVIANVLGIGGGGGAAAAGSGAVAGGAAGTGGAVAGGIGAIAGVGHVATLLAAAVVTAGGAVELQRTIAGPAHRPHHHARVVDASRAASPAVAPVSPSAAAAAAATYRAPAPPARPPSDVSRDTSATGGSSVKPAAKPAVPGSGVTGGDSPSGNFNTTGGVNEETGTTAASTCTPTATTTCTDATGTGTGTTSSCTPTATTTCTSATGSGTSNSTCTAATTSCTTGTGSTTGSGSGTGTTTGTGGSSGPTATASSAPGSSTSGPSGSTGSSSSTGTSTNGTGSTGSNGSGLHL